MDMTEMKKIRLLTCSIAIIVIGIVGILSYAHGKLNLMYVSLLVISVFLYFLQKTLGNPNSERIASRTWTRSSGFICLASALVWMFFSPSLFGLDSNEFKGIIIFFGGAGTFALLGVALLAYSEISRRRQI